MQDPLRCYPKNENLLQIPTDDTQQHQDYRKILSLESLLEQNRQYSERFHIRCMLLHRAMSSARSQSPILYAK